MFSNKVDDPTVGVLREVYEERRNQDEKWGVQDHPFIDPMVDGRGQVRRTNHYNIPSERYAKGKCQAEAVGVENGPSWAAILVEEVVEAVSAGDDDAIRAELLQVAAVAVAAIENLDRRRNL